MKAYTDKALTTYLLIVDYMKENRYSPTLQELADLLQEIYYPGQDSRISKSSVSRYMERLETKGLIERPQKPGHTQKEGAKIRVVHSTWTHTLEDWSEFFNEPYLDHSK